MRIRNKKINARQNSYYLQQLLVQLKNLLILIVIIFVNVILCNNKSDNDSPSYFTIDNHFHKTENSFANDSILAVHHSFINATNSMKATLRKKRQWNTMTLSPMSISYSRPLFGNVYGASPAYNSGVAYCPLSCTPCNYNQCRAYQIRCVPAIINCCCPSNASVYKYDLSDACDGDESVAGCINNLCGQGYVCTQRRFCCRCKTGKSIGNCVNGMCPNNYECNENNYCCETNKIAKKNSIGVCINGRCPVDYNCETDNKCYPKKILTKLTIGPSILSKCINDRCPINYTCGVGNLCYSNRSLSVPSGPFVLGKCDNSLCPVGYTCGVDDYCYANSLPLAWPDVLGRCLPGSQCPSGYTCSLDDFCHKAQIPKRRIIKPIKKQPENNDDDNDESDNDNEDDDDNTDDKESNLVFNKLRHGHNSKRETEISTISHRNIITKRPYETKAKRMNKPNKRLIEDIDDNFITTNQINVNNNNVKVYSNEKMT